MNNLRVNAPPDANVIVRWWTSEGVESSKPNKYHSHAVKVLTCSATCNYESAGFHVLCLQIILLPIKTEFVRIVHTIIDLNVLKSICFAYSYMK